MHFCARPTPPLSPVLIRATHARPLLPVVVERDALCIGHRSASILLASREGTNHLRVYTGSRRPNFPSYPHYPHMLTDEAAVAPATQRHGESRHILLSTCPPSTPSFRPVSQSGPPADRVGRILPAGHREAATGRQANDFAEQVLPHNTKLRKQCACLAPAPRERTRTLMPRGSTKLLRRPQTALRPPQRLFLTRKPSCMVIF